MGPRLPRMLRTLLGGAIIALAFAPTALAEIGAPVAVPVDVQATGISVSAATAATPTVDVSATAAPAPDASVDASAAAPGASAAASAGVPAATPATAPRAEAKATVGGERGVTAGVDGAGAPTVSARVDAAPASSVQVATRAGRADEAATPPVARAPLGLERAAGASSAGPLSLVLLRPESSLPSTIEESAISAVADAPPVGPPAAARGSTAPVRIGSERTGRRRVSDPAPAPFSHFPLPVAPPGGSAAGAAAAWLVLFFALAAGIALAPPTLRRRLRLRRIPIRSCSYRLLLERPG